MISHAQKAIGASLQEEFSQPHESEFSDIFCDVLEQNRSFFRDSAVLAAKDLGVFSNLLRSMTCKQLCFQLKTQPWRLQALLNVLVVEGFLEVDQKESTYTVKKIPDVKMVLPSYGWGRLAEVIRRDRPIAITTENLARLHDHLYEISCPAARQLWESTGAGPGRLLDLGSGAGAYSAAFLDLHQEASATLVDRPDVLELARQRLARYTKRAQFERRDALEPVSGQYDVALLANVLHLYGPKDCKKLVANAAQALRSGGRFIVKDMWIEKDRSGPPVAVYFALNMALYTDGGNVYTEEEMSRWVKEAGLGNLRVMKTSHSLIVVASK